MMGTNYADAGAENGYGLQQKVEEALGKLLWLFAPCPQFQSPDTGVHALGMVADVEIPGREFKVRPANWRWP